MCEQTSNHGLSPGFAKTEESATRTPDLVLGCPSATNILW